MKKYIQININNEGVETKMKRLTFKESRVFGRKCDGYDRDEEGFIFVHKQKIIINIWLGIFATRT